jgi:hypothetical protein
MIKPEQGGAEVGKTPFLVAGGDGHLSGGLRYCTAAPEIRRPRKEAKSWGLLVTGSIGDRRVQHLCNPASGEALRYLRRVVLHQVSAVVGMKQ